MIEFNSQNEFELKGESAYESWLNTVAEEENRIIQELGYVFCSDAFLLDLNQQYLDHDTFTDIITFDYCEEQFIRGEIYISTDRVRENAVKYEVSYTTELKRVMVHGLLHLCGHGDKGGAEKALMRDMETFYIDKFTS